MKKLIVTLSLFFLFCSVKSTYAIDFVFPVGKNYYFGRQNVPASNQLSVRMFASCNQTIVKENTILTSQSYNEINFSGTNCISGQVINLRAFHITNTAPKLTCKSHLFKMNYMIGLVEYPDGVEVPYDWADLTGGSHYGTDIRQSTGWQVRASNLPETNQVINGASHGFVVIDRDIEDLGKSQSQVYETTSGRQYYQGVHEYKISYFGYTYPLDGCENATTNNIEFGNSGSESNPILGLSSPQFINNSGPTPTFFVQKPQFVFVDPDTLQATDIQSIVTQLQTLRTESSIASQEEIDNAIRIAQQQEQAAEQRQEELMEDDTSQAESDMAEFMTTFDAGEDQTLSSVITAPIRLAAALQGLNCTPLQLPLPIVNTNLVLPCPRQKLQQAFPEVILLWDGITTGLIAYGLAVHLFQIMQKAKNPDDVGKIEIFEL